MSEIPGDFTCRQTLTFETAISLLLTVGGVKCWERTDGMVQAQGTSAISVSVYTSEEKLLLSALETLCYHFIDRQLKPSGASTCWWWTDWIRNRQPSLAIRLLTDPERTVSTIDLISTVLSFRGKFNAKRPPTWAAKTKPITDFGVFCPGACLLAGPR